MVMTCWRMRRYLIALIQQGIVAHQASYRRFRHRRHDKFRLASSFPLFKKSYDPVVIFDLDFEAKSLRVGERDYFDFLIVGW